MYKKDNQQMNYQQKLELRILFGQTKFVFKKKNSNTHIVHTQHLPITNPYLTFTVQT